VHEKIDKNKENEKWDKKRIHNQDSKDKLVRDRVVSPRPTKLGSKGRLGRRETFLTSPLSKEMLDVKPRRRLDGTEARPPSTTTTNSSREERGFIVSPLFFWLL